MGGSHAGRKESRFTAWRNPIRELRRMTPWKRIRVFGVEKPEAAGARVFSRRKRHARTS